ncbi:MAG: hypothetical protein ABW066_00850 [Sedimenticola sp.]
MGLVAQVREVEGGIEPIRLAIIPDSTISRLFHKKPSKKRSIKLPLST